MGEIKCGLCDKEISVKLRCSRCKSVYYCSRKCQIKHWKSNHKKECKSYEIKSDIICVCKEYLYYMKAVNAYGKILWCDICCKCINLNEYVYHCKKKHSLDHSGGYDICCNCVNKSNKKDYSIPIEYICSICGCYNNTMNNNKPKCQLLIAGFMRKYSDFVVSDVVMFIFGLMDVKYIKITYEVFDRWLDSMLFNINYNRGLKGLDNVKSNQASIYLRMNNDAIFDDIISEISKYYDINREYIELKCTTDDITKPNRVDRNERIKDVDRLRECTWEYLASKYDFIYNMSKYYANNNDNNNGNNMDSNGDINYGDYALYTCDLYFINYSEYGINPPRIVIAYKRKFIVKQFIKYILKIFKSNEYIGQTINNIKRHNSSTYTDDEIITQINDLNCDEFEIYESFLENTVYESNDEFIQSDHLPPLYGKLRIQQIPKLLSRHHTCTLNKIDDDESKMDDNICYISRLRIEYYKIIGDSVRNKRVSLNKDNYYRSKCDIFYIDKRTKLIDFILNEYVSYNKSINADTIKNNTKIFIRTEYILRDILNVSLQRMGEHLNINDIQYNIPLYIILERWPQFHLRFIIQ